MVRLKKLSAGKREKARKFVKPPGTAPGTLLVDPEAEETRIRVFAYNESEFRERDIESVSKLREFAEQWPVTWVDVHGLNDDDAIARIGEIFGLHRLALEDVVHTHQRPKLETFEDNIFIVLRAAVLDTRLETRQISIFLGRNFVITFQTESLGMLEPVRERIRQHHGAIRSQGADYLAYAILDTLVDQYFPLLEEFGERLDALERTLLTERNSTEHLSSIRSAKSNMAVLRRIVWPLRDVTNALVRDPISFITENTRLHLRDCYDHVSRIMDMLETHREMCSDLMDLHMNMINRRMNEVMKVLTIIATIFIPLSVVTGIYGMNFEHIPELSWRYGYFYALGVMGLIGLVFLVFFVRRGWVGGDTIGQERRVLREGEGETLPAKR